MLRKTLLLLSIAVLAATTAQADVARLVTLDAPSPLLEVRLMFEVGSAHDPQGLEGLANVTARAVLEGAFGDASDPVTKEKLAEMTSPWGSGAQPNVRLDKETTTFRIRVPADVLDRYLQEVLEPMFSKPLFLAEEIDRLVNESITNLTGYLRYEAIEMLGLQAIDNYVFEGTSYGHTPAGSVQGLKAITRDDVVKFFDQYYTPEHLILGVSSSQPVVTDALKQALVSMGSGKATFEEKPLAAPTSIEGRPVTVVALPDAGATGIHIAFPLSIDRTDPDFWPLYVANVYFGTHRDGHGNLYKQIRQERGYNYGDYSYVEHFAGRPYALFPPFNTPRHQQYFSIWIRPVATEYAHHILKAAVWELENMLREGISTEDVENSKNKAKVLYLNLAETSSRLLEAKLDDAFYGMEPGYLDAYLERIEAVTPEQVDAALTRYLQSDDMKIVVVTEADQAESMAAELGAGGVYYGKQLADYNVSSHEVDGQLLYELPASRLETIQRDAVWAHHPLHLDPSRIQVVTVEQLFETGDFVAETPAESKAR